MSCAPSWEGQRRDRHLQPKAREASSHTLGSGKAAALRGRRETPQTLLSSPPRPAPELRGPLPAAAAPLSPRLPGPPKPQPRPEGPPRSCSPPHLLPRRPPAPPTPRRKPELEVAGISGGRLCPPPLVLPAAEPASARVGAAGAARPRCQVPLPGGEAGAPTR